MKKVSIGEPNSPAQDTFRQIDRLLRSGDGTAARKLVEVWGRRRMSRADIPRFASLARRAGLPLLGLGRLKRLIYSTGRLKPDARAVERAEYAACLVAIGSTEEANELLEPLDAEEVSQVYLFRAFAAIKVWDYERAIPLLRAYWKSPRLTSYQRLVAQANLAEALTFEGNHREAVPILRALAHESRVRKNSFLLGKVLELTAQSYAERAKYDEAGAFLRTAQDETAQMQTVHQLILRKWIAIVGLLKRGPDEESLKKVAAVREEARHSGHGNTARDCDYFRALVTRDRQLFLKVYFGTPYPSFRRKMLAKFRGDATIPETFDWTGETADGGASVGPLLDLVETRHEPPRDGLGQGTIVRLLLTVLSSNFYDFFSTAALHSRLYPESFYNPDTSPARVYNTVKRVRRWLTDNAIPLAIEERNGTYGLSFQGEVRLRVTIEPALSPVVAAVKLLRLRLAGDEFQGNQAALALDVSIRTAQRILLHALECGLILRVGAGRASRYRFKDSPSAT